MTTVKISQLPAILGADTATTDVLPIVDVSGNVTNKITREEFFKNIASVDINGGTIDGAVIGGSSAAAGTFTTVTASGDVTIADKIVHSGDTNTAIRFPAADTVTVETSGAERLRVDSAGRFLVGTTTGVGGDFTSVRFNSGGSYPQALNMVDSNASASGSVFQVFRKSDDTYLGNIRRNSTDNAIFVGGNSYLSLGSGDTERMRITSTGLGIGTTSISYPLDVASASNATIRLTRTASHNVTLNAISGGSFTIGLDGSGGTTERMRIDASGNLGLGVTPSAWSWGGRVIDGTNNMVVSAGGTYGVFATNTFWNGTNWVYKSTAAAARYDQNTSAHAWFTAPSGTAGNAITFTQAMTLDASGNLGLGVTPSAWSGSHRAFQLPSIGIMSGLNANSSANYFNNSFFNGTSFIYGGNGAAARYEQAAGVHAFYNAPSGTAGNAITFTQAMTLDASGNLGIGTTIPSTKLDILDISSSIATRTLIRARDNAQSVSNVLAETKAIQFIGAANTEIGYLSFQHNQGYGELGSVDLAAIGSRPLRFFTNGTERARIDASGNLLVGTTVQNGRVTIRGSAASSKPLALDSNASYAEIQSYDNGPLYLNRQGNDVIVNATAGNLLVGTTSGSDRLTVSGNIRVTGVNGNGVSIFTDANSNVLIPRAYSITTSGGVAVFAQSDGRLGPNSSSQKYKTDITSITDVSWLYQLNPVSFYYKDQNGSGQGMLQYGLIAEEVDEVNPDLVHRLDGEVESVHYHKLYAPLLKAIQELKAEVDSLRAQLNP